MKPERHISGFGKDGTGILSVDDEEVAIWASGEESTYVRCNRHL